MAGPQRLLLTGATGFVGTHLRRHMAIRWPATTVIALGLGDGDAKIANVDLCDAAAVDDAVAAAKPDAIVHLAGQASVARGAAESALTWSVNVGGSLNLANAVARHASDATFLFASSSEVYGASFLSGRVAETSPLLPLSAYAKSKAVAEQMLAGILPPSAKLIVARPFNHTGPGQSSTFVLPSFAEQVAHMETGRQPPKLSVGNIEVRREFLDIRDVVDAYLTLIEASPRLPPHFTCNVASGDARPLRDWVEALRALSRVDFEVVVDPARLRPIDLPAAEGDAALLRAATGWAPRFSIAETLADLLVAARTAMKPG